MAIDPEKKLNTYGMGKYLLRKAFEGDWLPRRSSGAKKAAFSDAVGHSMVDDIKEYAESLYTDEEFQLRRANYSAHCMPFTKESLFYREIFEKYYHDQSRTIVGFWMPNKAWPGCNVNASFCPCAGKLRRFRRVILFPDSKDGVSAPGTPPFCLLRFSLFFISHRVRKK